MVMVTVPPKAKEDMLIVFINEFGSVPEIASGSTIVISGEAAAVMLISLASWGTFKLKEVRTETVVIAAPEGIYEHTSELSVASGKGVVNLVVDTTGESLPLARVTP